MIEKITQWNLVKYIGSLINPKNLGKRLDKIMDLYENNTLGDAAKKLFVWIVIIIVLSTIIDQIFYWMRPEQRYRLLKAISHLRKLKKLLFDKVKQLSKR